MKKLLIVLAILVVILALGERSRLLPVITDKFLKLPQITPPQSTEKRTLVYEESVVTKVVEEALPSVVTVGISTTTSGRNSLEFDPFNPFSPFRQVPGQKRKVEQNIGSGFIITSDGLIITNKHVVSDTSATYKVLTNDNKKHDVEKIYRDPVNDLAILKINASGLKALNFGDSSNLKLGQLVIAIGTPLGEFTNTVTSGIISGLGRGITAGSPFEGFVEKLDNVIQTDAAISPGNSGGPLLNSKGEVIGVNTAIASEGQNIGFAIPASVVKELVDNFNARGGSFERPYIGVRYKMIDKQTAVLNDLVEGAYVVEIIEGSPADKAGVQEEDIITELDGQRIKGENDQELAKLINQKRIGDRIQLKVWRSGEIKNFSLMLESAQ
ncbi:trypsin-like peptidase domain-containing protein [Candidatus Roizmanbacteria bacterium]|nr:trypsin-like peptidase domain-containing protein [Candidatus Roizmanbacteria bacterium]